MTLCRVLLSFQIALLWMSICGAESLYNVLGVKRTSSTREIQEAYTKLVKDLYVNTVEIPKLRISRYPDPNEDPNAIEKFVKIREAYATLGNPKKRLQYDRFRCTSSSGRQPSQSNATIPWFLHPLKIFERFFTNDLGFRENTLYVSFYEKANRIDKYSISRREYQTIILPNSHRKPCVIFAFTDCCWGCNTIEEYLTELESFGFCAATFNIEESGDLRSYFGIDTIPALIAVSAGRVRYYFNGSVTAQTLRDFIRTLFSPSAFFKVTDESYQGFLDGFEDNRVRAIFFGPKPDPPIHFMACAFYYQDNVAFAYVYTKDPNATDLMKKYNVNNIFETLLLFNEETNIPLDISTQQFSRTKLDEILETNKYLMLPRLSSQKYFDELCPPENKVNERVLCVILVTKKKKEHDEYRDSFRNYSQRSQFDGHERVRFSYIYEDTQKDLVLALTKERMQENDTAPLKVAILWREDEKRLSYEWLETGWDLKSEKEICEETLVKRLTDLLTNGSIRPNQTNLPELCNEHGASLLVRIGHSLLCWVDDLWLYLTSYKFVMCMELLLSLIIYFLMGYILWKAHEILEYILWKACKIMGYILWKPYEILKVQRQSRPTSRSSNKRCYFMHELKRSTYKQLVQEADPGLTIVILVDNKSKYKLLRLFSEITKPYSRDRTLTFGFIKLESHIHWFCELLREGGDSSMMLSDINLRNKISKSVGTVLGLNGFEKYYCIYKDTRAELLHGLKIWLDKIPDGSVNKFGITNWPAMTDTKQS